VAKPRLTSGGEAAAVNFNTSCAKPLSGCEVREYTISFDRSGAVIWMEQLPAWSGYWKEHNGLSLKTFLTIRFTHFTLQPSNVNVSANAFDLNLLSGSLEWRVSNSYSKAITIFEPIRRW
jgi:hypothetical protein